MSDELKDKCYICKRDILNKETCRGLLDGRLGVDYYHDGKEVIFYDDDDQSDAVLICEDCRPEHIRLMLHGKAVLGALRVALECLGSFDPPEDDQEIEGFYEDLETIQQAIAKIEGSTREPTDQKKG